MIVEVIPAGDLALDETVDLVWLTGPAYIRRKLSARFQFFLGEWFLDRRQGIPYFRDVFVKNPDLDLIHQTFRRVILTTPGVLVINTFELTYNDSARRLSFSFHATVEGGDVVVRPEDKDFILSLDL